MGTKGNGGVPASGGGLTPVASAHLTAQTGAIPVTELLGDSGAAGMFLFLCQLTTTTASGSAANASLHVRASATHGQTTSQAKEVSAPGASGGATCFLNLAQLGDAPALAQTKYVDAASVLDYSVDVDVDTYEYALDIQVYRL